MALADPGDGVSDLVANLLNQVLGETRSQQLLLLLLLVVQLIGRLNTVLVVQEGPPDGDLEQKGNLEANHGARGVEDDVCNRV